MSRILMVTKSFPGENEMADPVMAAQFFLNKILQHINRGNKVDISVVPVYNLTPGQESDQVFRKLQLDKLLYKQISFDRLYEVISARCSFRYTEFILHMIIWGVLSETDREKLEAYANSKLH